MLDYVAEKWGETPVIWRDNQLRANDNFDREIKDKFPKLKILVSVITPRYVTSDWCKTEVEEFLRAAKNNGGIEIENNSRVLKSLILLLNWRNSQNQSDNIQATNSIAADSCAGASTIFTITVLPAPVLTSTKDTSSCNNNPFTYTATSSSSDANTSFRWKRDFVTGISNPAHADTLAKFINETLHNTTTPPIIVNYLFTLSTGNGCDTTETLNVTVNPTPVINLVRDTTYCNGSLAQPILFTSPSPNATITWTSDTQIGFGISGSSSIPAFIARNLIVNR